MLKYPFLQYQVWRKEKLQCKSNHAHNFLLVGFMDGCWLGLDVGFTVGTLEGFEVGFLLGLGVGFRVGPLDGFEVGVVLGFPTLKLYSKQILTLLARLV